MGEVLIRPATPADALCLGVLATQVFLDTYATTGIRPALAREVLRAYSTEAFATCLADPQSVVQLQRWPSTWWASCS